MYFIEKVIETAKNRKKKIVLPEATDIRILKAASILEKEKIVDVILVGSKKEIIEIAKLNKINIKNIEIIEPKENKDYNRYVKELMKINQALEEEKEKYEQLILDPVYFGMMMVYDKIADGLVSGASHTTKETLRPIMKIFKKKSHSKMMSTFLVMDMPELINEEDSTIIFADCAFHERPGALALSEIAIESANSFKKLFNKEPSISMLSGIIDKQNSTVNMKIDKALNRIRKKAPYLNTKKDDGLETLKYNDANVFIFPDINSGNICCKLVERFANAKLYGPICQGIEGNINDLSRGCSVDDIIGTVAITSVLAD